MRLKALVSNPTEKVNDPDLPFIALEHLESGTGRLLSGIALEGKDADDSVLHQPGDVRFGKLRPYLAKSFLAEGPGAGSGELMVLRPGPLLLSRYLWYVTLSQPFVDWAAATSYGVKMPRTSWGALGAFKLDPPPLEEQRNIVEFLDAETSLIDGLIEEQVQLQALVAERVSAGREWLYQGSGTRRFPLASLLRQAPTYGVLVPRFEDEGVPFVRVGDIAKVARGVLPDRFISVEQSSEYRRTILAEGDVLVSVVGSLSHSAVVPEALVGANVARAVSVLRPANGVPSNLLAEFVHTRQYQDQAGLATGSDTAQPTLNMGDLQKFRVQLPDSAEARLTLARELEAVVAHASELQQELDLQLNLLRERRQALIAAAVTGGLDAVVKVA